MAITGETELARLREQPAELLRRLIRFDTTNPPGNERECIAWIEELVRAAGAETRIVARDPDRPNLIARLPGEGTAPPLLLQGHVDVVTTQGQDWSHPPFEGVVEDGYVWGRGALDMKGGVAMMLAAFLRAAEGPSPAGDLILCLMADEEAGSDLGAAFLVDEHANLFEGARYAIGEFGGFAMEIAGRRFYPIEVAERQMCWMRAKVRGPGGHGSIPMRAGTMAKLARILRTLDRRRLPAHVTPVAREMIERIAAAVGLPAASVLRALLRPALTDRALRLLGERGKTFDPLLHNTVNVTVVRGGDKVNVVPAEIDLQIDGRLLPGFAPADLIAELHALVGDDLEIVGHTHDPGPAEPDMGMWSLLEDALREADPTGTPIPLLMPGVSDARFFSRLGIQTYGYLPMQLPEDLKFMSLVHAADERVPAATIAFGTATITDVIRRYGR